MANVLVNSTSVNKQQRNKRNWGGSQLNNVVANNPFIPVGKTIIEFNTDTPSIPDYSIYADIYGQWPTIDIYTRDIYGSLIKRSELPYFTFVNGLIDTVVFGTLADGVQEGFITIAI